MNHRQRLKAVLRHEPVDRVVDYEFGMWQQTHERWIQEGLPKAALGENGDPISRYFQTDERREPGISLGRLADLKPGFEEKILKQKGDHLIVQDKIGVIYEKLRPELGASIPKYLKFPIENRNDWEQFRDNHLNPATPGRLPADIDAAVAKAKNCSGPVSVYCGSLYGRLRNYMGVENLSYALYDKPEWIEEILEHITSLVLLGLDKLAGKVEIDIATWWEDMCYKNGPLVSPEWVHRHMTPRYKKITSFLKDNCNCFLNIVDCDGNIHPLVDEWLEGGVNCMFPLEAAHTDVFKIYNTYGKKVGLRGAFDKRALIKGPAAIDAEFERLRPLIDKKCIIPHIDHLVPPDVSFKNYRYYRERKLEIIGKMQ